MAVSAYDWTNNTHFLDGMSSLQKIVDVTQTKFDGDMKEMLKYLGLLHYQPKIEDKKTTSLFTYITPISFAIALIILLSLISVKEIISVLESGKQAQIVVSIPEGLTMRRIGEILEKKDVVSKDDFLLACKNPELLNKYNLKNIKNFSKKFLF